MDDTGDSLAIENHKLQEKIKQLEDELRKRPKHGEKKLFRDIVYHDTGFQVIKSTPQQLDEAKRLAILARDYQIDTKGNVFTNKDGTPRKRFNECGNDMEGVLKEASDGKPNYSGPLDDYTMKETISKMRMAGWRKEHNGNKMISFQLK